MMKTVQCPTCRKSFEWDSKPESRPFCSERCRLIDLGDWLEEKHRIPEDTATKAYLPPEDDLH
ncbi:MAG: DNA gyrase inhibitor YacG [Sedimenticola sp.]|uniref:DNA gyrase inhibitor YacG n=1 Tax=Sedimenticola thiotaurini TaxID=1543721 RepID=A0A558DBY3_9GAMM|nr:DNA gyrase inhibitor YacG [Sedimenticola sp.]MCW8950105.1 DNA gyrase inhibitor YacG [Sedimenticola sp.]MCW8974989.1 DNA gyrase inhibitor YacG [Sedimenticola sp.]MDF1528083.1 DNA gyrase inhibitor YacG [Sedimenticola sp.]TVT58539.1 MAG: DNA gyrase inhibitor YacG [Sedimenticola thiotaurini]